MDPHLLVDQFLFLCIALLKDMRVPLEELHEEH
jgi:hypothetical protein